MTDLTSHRPETDTNKIRHLSIWQRIIQLSQQDNPEILHGTTCAVVLCPRSLGTPQTRFSPKHELDTTLYFFAFRLRVNAKDVTQTVLIHAAYDSWKVKQLQKTIGDADANQCAMASYPRHYVACDFMISPTFPLIRCLLIHQCHRADRASFVSARRFSGILHCMHKNVLEAAMSKNSSSCEGAVLNLLTVHEWHAILSGSVASVKVNLITMDVDRRITCSAQAGSIGNR
jgi:hypothetical protein